MGEHNKQKKLQKSATSSKEFTNTNLKKLSGKSKAVEKQGDNTELDETALHQVAGGTLATACCTGKHIQKAVIE